MRRQTYYPSRIANQILWLGNFRNKLPGYETVLGLPSAHVDACVASCNYTIYALGEWLTAVRDFGPAATEAVDLLLAGSGPDAVVLPVFTVPTLPTGVASVPPGALNRLFDLVAIIKAAPGYTEAIGQDLGIVGPASNEFVDQAMPAFKLQIVPGPVCQAVKIVFKKFGHEGVWIECQRGNGEWQFVAVDSESPYLDERPLLVAGAPEVRKFRLRFWDKGTPNGNWTDVASVTVAP
ncbi:MAG: hypothetical protein NT105_05885 [Verrucomicrobia bacterium]|nr:hypothetical protein [Verrucomicrobiota bacterium]